MGLSSHEIKDSLSPFEGAISIFIGNRGSWDLLRSFCAEMQRPSGIIESMDLPLLLSQTAFEFQIEANVFNINYKQIE